MDIREGRGEEGKNSPNHSNRLVKFSWEKLLWYSNVKKNCCQEMCRVNDRKYGIEFMPPFFCVLNSY